MSGSASLGLEQQILQHTLGIATMAAPSQVYVALCHASPVPAETTVGAEVSGGGYARVPATFAMLASPADAAANVGAVEFPAAIASWGVLGYFELWSAQTGGERLYWGPLVDTADPTIGAAFDVAAGDVVRFPAGMLIVQASETAMAAGGPYLPTAGGEMFGPLDYITTGGTAVRSAQDRAGQIIDIRDFGAVCDGTTDDTAAWGAALAMPTGTVIRVPQNCTTIIAQAAGFAMPNRTVSIIGEGRGSVIKLQSGLVITASDMFRWNGTQVNLRIENLTFDLNNIPQPASLKSFLAVLTATGVQFRNLRIINAPSNLYHIACNSVADLVIDGCYFHQTTATSLVQSKAIAIIRSLGVSRDGRVTNNVLVNTNTNFTGCSRFYIAGNDISGWGVGAGIATEGAESQNIIIGNRCHDSQTVVDMFGIAPNGIENWSSITTIANNECWNCAGAGIAHGGANSTLVGNTCWDNTAGGGGGGGIAVVNSGGFSGSGSVIVANHCYDSGVGRQTHGFRINNSGITNLTIEANKFRGTVADVSLSNATYLANIDYVPRVVTTGLGVWNATPPVAKPTVSGAKGSNAALASLLTALAAYGLITDSSTA